MNPAESDNVFIRNSIDVAAKLFLIGLLLVLSFNIIEPFVLPVIRVIIIAAAFNPMINKLAKMIGDCRKAACIILSLVAVTVLVVAVAMLASFSSVVIFLIWAIFMAWANEKSGDPVTAEVAAETETE